MAAAVANVQQRRPQTAGRIRDKWPSHGTVSQSDLQKQQNDATSLSIARLEAKRKALASHSGLSVLAAFEVGRNQARLLQAGQEPAVRPTSAPARRRRS